MLTVSTVTVILRYMSTHLLDMPRTSARSEQLVAASERATHDPFRDIDWATPIDDSAYHLPPELLALYGTATWEQMSESERITYSRHETAALFGAGIWFENALMQIVFRHLTEIDVSDPMHRYLLVEVARELRQDLPQRVLAHPRRGGSHLRQVGRARARRRDRQVEPALPVE